MGLMAYLANVSYVLLLVGGLNWLTTGTRLVIDQADNNTISEPIPDLLSWGGETFQVIVYFAVGIASLALLAMAMMGFWVRKGEGCVVCV